MEVWVTAESEKVWGKILTCQRNSVRKHGGAVGGKL